MDAGSVWLIAYGLWHMAHRLYAIRTYAISELGGYNDILPRQSSNEQ